MRDNQNNQEKIVKLKWPIPIPQKDNNPIMTNELRIGRFKAKHFRLLPDSFTEDGGQISAKEIIPLIAGLANIPESSADEIDMEDIPEVAEALQSFLLASQATGKK